MILLLIFFTSLMAEARYSVSEMLPEGSISAEVMEDTLGPDLDPAFRIWKRKVADFDFQEKLAAKNHQTDARFNWDPGYEIPESVYNRLVKVVRDATLRPTGKKAELTIVTKGGSFLVKSDVAPELKAGLLIDKQSALISVPGFNMYPPHYFRLDLPDSRAREGFEWSSYSDSESHPDYVSVELDHRSRDGNCVLTFYRHFSKTKPQTTQELWLRFGCPASTKNKRAPPEEAARVIPKPK